MHGHKKMSLILGTAQLGMDYGIANQLGAPNQDEAFNMVRTAWALGIEGYDTAQAYGSSEAVLGACFKENFIKSPRLFSKLAPDLDYSNSKVLSEALNKSLDRLGQSALTGLTLHREDLLSHWSHGLGSTLLGFKDDGRIHSIGVSVYSPEVAVSALKTDGIDYIQIPTNIFDRRFENAGVAEISQQLGKLIQIRSIFLQGLILMELVDIPPSLSSAKQYIVKLDELCQKYELNRIQVSIAFIKKKFPDASMVLGAESVEQIQELMNNYKIVIQDELIFDVLRIFPDVPTSILNPASWNV